jgi:hypothetical protein
MNTEVAIRNLQSIVSAPLYQHLISKNAIKKLKNILNRPYTAEATLRMRANNLTSYFANASKAFHSGKGDDFESVAVVLGNPALPISLSAAGLVSNTPPVGGQPVTRVVFDENTEKEVKMECNYPLWEAMKEYGGHYITVNLDLGDLLDAAKSGALKKLAEGGKGKTRSQIDYLIIIPGKPYKVFILELKAGKSHLVMNYDEEIQMAKSEWIFKKWLGPDTQVEILYHPFLSDDLSFARNYAVKHASTKVTYLTLNGVCQLLNLNPNLVKRIGSLRARYHGNMAAFEGYLSKALFAARDKLEAEAAQETVEEALEDALKNAPILKGSAQNVLGTMRTNLGEVFSGKLGSGVNIADADWKPAIQYIAYLMVKREQLRKNINKPGANTATILRDMYTTAAHILAINEKRGRKILRPNVRNQLNAFVTNSREAHKNIQNASSELRTDYIINYIELRAKMLGKQNTNLNKVNAQGKLRRVTTAESKAALKNISAAWSKATPNQIANYMNKFRQLSQNRRLLPENRGSLAKTYAKALTGKSRVMARNLRANAEGKIKFATTNENCQKLANNAAALFTQQMNELDAILKFLSSWSTNALALGSINNKFQKNAVSEIKKEISALNSNSTAIMAAAAAKKKRKPVVTAAEEKLAKEMAAKKIAKLELVEPGPRMNSMGGMNIFGGN